MEPYLDTVAHLRDELRRLDLLLRRHVVEWRRTRGSEGDLGGLYVSDAEVDRLLADSAGAGLRDGDAAGRSDVSDRRRDGAVDSDRRRDGADPSPRRGWRVGIETTGRERTDASPEGGAAGTESELTTRIAEATRRIRDRQEATPDAASTLRLVALTERFDLGPRHVDALLVALAPDLDRKYGTVYGYLRDDVTTARPTVGLTLDVLYRSEAERLSARDVFARGSPLRRNRLVRLSGDARTPSGSREVVVAERVVAFLLGTDGSDPADSTDGVDGLAGATVIPSPDASLDDLLAEEETMAAIDRERRAVALDDAGDARPRMTVIHGREGAGKTTAVEALAAAAGRPLVRVDASALGAGQTPGGSAEGDLRETVRLLSREVALRDATLHVENVPSPTEEPVEGRTSDGTSTDFGPDGAARRVDPSRILAALDDVNGHVFVTGTDPPSNHRPRGVEAHEFATVELPVPSYELRRDRWAAVDGLPDDVDPTELAATFRLTGGQIDDAISVARHHADGDLDASAVYRGCRSQSSANLAALARKVDPVYTFDDIVLPPTAMTRLREVAAHVTDRGRVYADWGFGEKFAHGDGLVVLFNGPSGTGKTMAADVVAGAAGLDLYKIDLANVVSKYIGETEKNLGRIFDEAADSDAILLFDEADSLFGERTEVSDAHDRYANVEVNYLLQRVEEHDGTVILTTNLEGNIDDAFRRRIHVRIDFPVPDETSRAAIWRSVFPPETPVDDLDVEFLSSFELTGGNIRNVALTAAFLAADDGGRVEMDHVVAAAKREFRKMGKLVPPAEFDDYADAGPTGEPTEGGGGRD